MQDPADGLPPEAARVFAMLADERGDLELLDALLGFVAQHALAGAAVTDLAETRGPQAAAALTAAKASVERAPRLADSMRYLVETLGREGAVASAVVAIGKYARPGAVRALGKRKGDPKTECPDCRGRGAIARQVAENLKRYSDGRAQGRADSDGTSSGETSA